MCVMRNSIVALSLLLACSPAPAADIGLREIDWSTTSKERLFTVRVQDKIEAGDLWTIKKLLKQAMIDHRKVVALELGSWGGDADTGMAIASFVYFKKMKVVVNGVCSSACAFAALVALGRGQLMVRSTGVLGVHQVYVNSTRLADVPWTRQAARTLRGWGAPELLLTAMVDTPPSGMKYYYVDDLVGMGAFRLDSGWAWWPW